MFQKILTSALFAGVAAGLIAALLQFWLVTPVLLEGEEYETGAKSHYAGVLVINEAEGNGSEGAAEEAEEAEEEEAENPRARHGMTAAVNVITFTGFGLILVAGFALASQFGATVTARSGIIWGLAGFIAVQLAPSAGLYPELPGTPAADVVLRQYWWVTTVVATVVGLAFIAFGKAPWLPLAGVALMAAPHVIGAPHLDGYAGVAPPELAALFVARTLAVGCAAWAVLGCIAGHFWSRAQAA
ncbi:putative cobalt transporter subunit (CbtA) [Pseudoruegeria aquimaris]|uniref:Putative cobalt transporter subunit (CbtA) n=1 Tax=Pseudoruegeria aquimaris TaxID=393663 RepID=A0A1Y5S220_9RHOB|nr:CbtA family protein [Pseudoruegeria aquimaris]SLN29887.1 putative cobalt transporter subunit (CbtA) [Pseudoruegeria aquimaris]